MKVAVVHDWLNTKDGGAESALRDILACLPEADIFCLIYNKNKFSELVAGRQVKTSFLQHFPGWLKRRPQFMLPFIRRAVNNLNLTGYDLIVSSSGAWTKNVRVPSGARHICYCYTPARMLWVDWPAYLDSFDFAGFRFIPFSKLIITRLVSRLRLWDYYGSRSVDEFIAISHYVAGRIKKFYGRESSVIYPGVNTKLFQTAQTLPKQDYFVVISTLARYKNLDIVIQAFKENKQHLIIAGDGADRNRLEKVARGSSQIEFRGFVSSAEKVRLLQQAQALIFSSLEDFGIVPVEALAAGSPVLALRGGGVAETITEGKTGLFFTQLTSADIRETIEKLADHHFAERTLKVAAEQFSVDHFRAQFTQFLKEKGGLR